MLASMRRNTVVLEFRSPKKASGATAEVDGIDGITGGLQFPSITIQRAWLRIGERTRSGHSAPVPLRTKMRLKLLAAGKTHGDKSDGVLPVRPGRPRRTPQ